MNKMSDRDLYKIRTLESDEFPEGLHEIPQPPEKLFIVGELPNPHEYYYLAVVGSRKYTSYGREATERIISGLAGYPIVIVSGLAMGIDGIAHRAALDAGLFTVALPGSGLNSNTLYPRTHLNLAREIIDAGGALLSEFEPDFRAAPWTFPQRNRIMAGMTQGTLIIEAEEKSGTLITARLALEYNRTVLAVPGNIDSPASKGTNWLIRQGATPITRTEDILDALNIAYEEESGQRTLPLENLSSDEILIWELLHEPKSKDALIRESGLEASRTLITLTSLELKDYIKEEMSMYKRIA